MAGGLHDPLLLGGLRCAVRLAPAAVLAQLPSAQALHICKVWVINNFDCRAQLPPQQRHQDVAQ
ncbi:hypothetical protein HaLaN_28429 [Haematococcus lacustris]|uniref:Uncharacterized protein n=1 Tax=Haematococcus lacustris TaxID=44745 RepID=A0A6A0AD08_HAELA|nr:hypothetical protein HaLaN_28429 [Haematococcus lacustris]